MWCSSRVRVVRARESPPTVGRMRGRFVRVVRPRLLRGPRPGGPADDQNAWNAQALRPGRDSCIIDINFRGVDDDIGRTMSRNGIRMTLLRWHDGMCIRGTMPFRETKEPSMTAR